jgi:hypothetical protein
MPLVVKDRVKETTTTAGTGTITLAGAVSGYQSFSVIGNGNTTYYTIVGGTEWEVGIGTYTSSGTTLSRDTVLESSTGGTKVDFAAGVKDVFVTYPAERSVTSDYANTFTDSQVISVDSATDAIRITQIGTGNALLVEDSANPDSTPVVVTNAGRFVIGYTTSIAGVASVNSFYQQHGTSNAGASAGFYDWQNVAIAGPIYNFNKSKSGTIGTRGIVASGDRLGAILFGGDDGTNFISAGQIACLVDGTPGTNDMPGRLTFSTTADGASTVTERMRIDSAGNVGIATLTPGSALDVKGTLRLSGATSGYVGLAPAAAAGSTTYTLPSADGTTGQVLSTNGSGVLSWVTAGGGSGDVVGPASATDNAIVRFDGTTGKLIQNSAVTIADTSGDITGGSYNRVTITAPATGSTLTIADGKTLTANNSITLAGTDATTMTFPATSTTVAGLGITQTFTAVQTLTDPAIIGAITEDIFTITDGAAFEVDPGNGSIQLITLGASRTPKATNFAAGESVTLMVNDGTAYTLTWTDSTWGTGGVIWVGGTAPTLATTGYTVIEFWKVSTQVYGALVGSVA